MKMRPGSSKSSDSLAVHAIASRSEVIRRCRGMLDRTEQIVLLDVFPGPLDELRADIERAAARGIQVALKAYRPTEVGRAKVFVDPYGESVIERWPGEWINMVRDGEEHVLALVQRERDGVHQAVWSESPYLSWVYHSAVAAELVLASLESQIHEGADHERLTETLLELGCLAEPQAAGYRALVRRFTEKRQGGASRG